jgi:imidazolonepropionase-like amidohydrolase
MLKQGTWYCPTMAPYYGDWAAENTPDGKRDRKRAADHEISLEKAAKAGVKTVFGTDIGGIPWTEPMANEFEYMVKFGFTPMGAIQAATSRAAEMLEMRGEIGVIAPGAYADVVAVNGDPLKLISELKNVLFVMHDGAVFKNEASGK